MISTKLVIYFFHTETNKNLFFLTEQLVRRPPFSIAILSIDSLNSFNEEIIKAFVAQKERRNEGH
jgi:hypothetical protein